MQKPTQTVGLLCSWLQFLSGLSTVKRLVKGLHGIIRLRWGIILKRSLWKERGSVNLICLRTAGRGGLVGMRCQQWGNFVIIIRTARFSVRSCIVQ